MPSSPPRHSRSLSLTRSTRPWATVFSGGLVGSAARLGVGHILPVTAPGFPVGTLVVNLVGSMVLGFFLARRTMSVSGPLAIQFWGIGVLGSFTTFSAFGLEIVQLVGLEEPLIAGGYVTASVFGGVLLGLVGRRIGEALK